LDVAQGVHVTAAPPETRQPLRILLIEQGDAPRALVAELLRAADSLSTVLVRAERLAEATQELLDHGASAVVLELGASAAVAVEAVAQLRAAAPQAPIVVLGELDEEQALGAIRAGAQDVLQRSQLTAAGLARALRFAVERQRAQAQLAHRALHDPLTGLPNRELFLDRLGVALDRSRRSGGRVAVLFLDVDNFKQVNDSLGHAAGDRLLAVLADRLRSMLRPMDTVARFGGDEFTLLFEDLASEREVVLVAERIARAAQLPIRLEEGEARVTVSIGIAVVDDPAVPPEAAIRDADAAMYRAKERGRSRFELFDEAAKLRATRRLELERELRRAVESDQLRLHYQPRFSLGERQGLIGFEALVRWEHPQRGLLAPGEFIPLAEEIGMASAVGELVAARALAQLASWRAHHPELTVSINLSPRQLEDAGLPAMLVAAAREAGLDPSALIVEIGERAFERNAELATRVSEALRQAGVRIAIDDYGTGAASLARLRRLPAEALKLHEGFLADLGSDPRGGAFVRALVGLAHSLGMSLIAEGVQTDAQLRALRAAGADAAQGTLLGRPLPAEAASALLAST
jgi:diguanylate cyclase (GGDEF)-like protein